MQVRLSCRDYSGQGGRPGKTTIAASRSCSGQKPQSRQSGTGSSAILVKKSRDSSGVIPGHHGYRYCRTAMRAPPRRPVFMRSIRRRSTTASSATYRQNRDTSGYVALWARCRCWLWRCAWAKAQARHWLRYCSKQPLQRTTEWQPLPKPESRIGAKLNLSGTVAARLGLNAKIKAHNRAGAFVKAAQALVALGEAFAEQAGARKGLALWEWNPLARMISGA